MLNTILRGARVLARGSQSSAGNASFRAEVVNLPSVMQFLARVQVTAPKAVMGGAEVEMQQVLDEAVELVPKDTGALAASGRLTSRESSKNYQTIAVTFGAMHVGGTFVNYAWVVHEDLFAQHPHGGQAKYLEDPMRRRLNGMTDRINRTAKARFRP